MGFSISRSTPAASSERGSGGVMDGRRTDTRGVDVDAALQHGVDRFEDGNAVFRSNRRTRRDAGIDAHLASRT